MGTLVQAVVVFVRAVVAAVGYSPEDGEDVLRDVFYVVAEAPDGSRWGHAASFHAATPADAQARAEALAARVRAHLAAGGTLNPDHWRQEDPAYGSAAYQSEEPYLVAREREDALAGL